MFSVDPESWEGTTLQEISGLSALSRALTLPPPCEKKNTLLYVFSPVECVGNYLSPFVSMGAVCLHLQPYLAQGTFLSSETWDSQIPLEIMSFLPPACLYPERSTRGPEP